MTIQKRKLFSTRKLVATAILAAISYVFMLLEFSLPFMPNGKLDFSWLPALIAAYGFGPVSGLLVCLVKDLLHMPLTTSSFVGELCDFILGVSFVVPAGIVYYFVRNRKGALIGTLSGAALSTALCIPLNYFVIFPFFKKAYSITDEVIIGMYQAILPFVNTIIKCILVFHVPFTLSKGLFITAVAFIIYKHISPLLHGKETA